MASQIELLRHGLAAFELRLEDEVLASMLAFLDELQRWNRQINLTAITDRREAIEKHLIDSLLLLNHVGIAPLLDIGSGAGLPAIPLALTRPELHITSVDSVAKKISFQKHVRRNFLLKNLEPLNCRIEALPAEKQFDQITARAFASVAKIAELAAPLLAPSGRLLLMRGLGEDQALIMNGEFLSTHGLKLTAVNEYRLPYSGARRQILEISAR